MKKILFVTIIFIAVPSFLVLKNFPYTKKLVENVVNEIKEENNELITIKVKQVYKNKIIELDLEDYILGVIAGEMPLSFNMEALKAQAVAARTYAVRRINKNNTYDVVDTTANQVYLDNESLKEKLSYKYDEYLLKLKTIIEETKGEYVDYNGTYADTLFFSTSSGNTENSEDVFGTKITYLQSVSSTWDEEESPVYEEKNYFTKEEFCKKLNTNCNTINIKVIDVTSAGKVKKISINNKLYTGSDIMSLFNLRSNCFTITVNNNVIITTKGFGHGVGMSQYGAEGMANNGYNYKEILEHYYQGTTIKKLY